MGTYVTANGFVKPTLAELVTFYETQYQTIFGQDIDLDPTGPFGQLVAFHAKRDADLFDAIEEIYTARNPAEATGTSLDYISAETGVQRVPASATLCREVLLYGDIGTVIGTGKQAKQANLDTLFSLLATVTLSQSAFRDLEVFPDTTTEGESPSFTLDGELVSYTVQAGDDENDVINGLITSIGTTSYTGNTSNVNGEYLRLYDVNNNHAILTPPGSNVVLGTVANAGTFEADDKGNIPVPASTLVEIATPVTGWDSVTNPIAGDTGRDVETDEELRIRRPQAFQVGKGTEEAIRQNLLQDVEGVTQVEITSNRSDVTDGEGRPPHSFECVIEGGTDTDIGGSIWDSMPAGIEPYGLESVTIQDSTGRDQDIGFSRPVPQYIHVRVSRDTYDEETYPTNGDELIKEAIVSWSLTEYTMGVDIIYQRIAIPVYSVPGVSTILIEVDATPNPGDTPTYASANITMDSRDLATFDVSRIIVQDIP